MGDFDRQNEDDETVERRKIDKQMKLQIEELRADIADLSEKVEVLMTVKEDIAALDLVWNNATGALWVVKRISYAVIGIGAFLAGWHSISTFMKGSGNGG